MNETLDLTQVIVKNTFSRSVEKPKLHCLNSVYTIGMRKPNSATAAEEGTTVEYEEVFTFKDLSRLDVQILLNDAMHRLCTSVFSIGEFRSHRSKLQTEKTRKGVTRYLQPVSFTREVGSTHQWIDVTIVLETAKTQETEEEVSENDS